jgi:hypothetical protein
LRYQITDTYEINYRMSIDLLQGCELGRDFKPRLPCL